MKHRTVLIRNFLLLFVLLPFCSSSQEKLDLFIWAGQSNAQGWMEDAAYYPEEGKELDESILFNWTFVDNENTARDYYLNLNHLLVETPRLAAVIWMPAQLLGQESVVSAKVTSYDSIPLLNAEVKTRGMGMSDIQNIRVKGSMATIYCYRGGNGVIEVDTKRGKFK
ncbi:MAG: hypothetical protein ACQETA_01715 [Bacteroidota bacterium]